MAAGDPTRLLTTISPSTASSWKLNYTGKATCSVQSRLALRHNPLEFCIRGRSSRFGAAFVDPDLRK